MLFPFLPKRSRSTLFDPTSPPRLPYLIAKAIAIALIVLILGGRVFRASENKNAAAAESSNSLRKAKAFHKGGRARKAVEAYQRLIRSDPKLNSVSTDRDQVWKEFASDLISIGQIEAAADILDHLKGRQSDPEVLDLRGSLAARSGQPDEARQFWLRSIALSGDRSTPWLELGLLDLRVMTLNQAADRLQQAFRCEPESLTVNIALAKLYRLEGDDSKAIAAQARVDRIRATLPPPMGGMGEMDD